ncbi:MAG: hypothetical protein AAGN46_09555, partial [Acidobacteriota bacterium]
SKPVVLPLLAAPLEPLFGAWGIAVLNVAAFGVAGWLAFGMLRRRLGARAAAWTLVTFAGAATVLPYALWRMADALQLALALAGLSLCFGGASSKSEDSGGDGSPPGRVDRVLTSRLAAPLGACLLGLLVPMRVNNAVIAAVPVLAALLDRRGRDVAMLATAVALGAGLGLGAAELLIDSANPYRSPRTTFTPATGYPAGEGAAQATQRFDRFLARHHLTLTSVGGGSQVAYSALYFWIGRHTGVLVYFPAVIALLWAARRRDAGASRRSRRAEQIAACVGLLAAVAFLVGWKPENYFGGATFLGNRYLLPAYPLLLVAAARCAPSPRALVVTWTLAALGYSSAFASALRHPEPGRSQSHTLVGLYRALPYESTARSLAGRRDRYWTGQFVRFVDPFAEVDRRSFRLRAADPPAEILFAGWEPPGALRLHATASAAATLRVEDWRGEWRFDLEPGQASDFVLEPSPPWRRHGFWFEGPVYTARTLRFDLVAPAGAAEHPEVELRFLGDPAVVERAFAARLVAFDLAAPLEAGTTTAARLQVENASRRHWEAEDSTPVEVVWRVLDAEGARLAGGSHSIERRVAPGETLDLALSIEGPARAGFAFLEVDLVLDGIAAFADRLGAPLVRQRVRVRRRGPGGATSERLPESVVLPKAGSRSESLAESVVSSAAER